MSYLVCEKHQEHQIHYSIVKSLHLVGSSSVFCESLGPIIAVQLHEAFNSVEYLAMVYPSLSFQTSVYMRQFTVLVKVNSRQAWKVYS